MINFEPSIIDQCRKGNRKAQMQLYTTFCKRVYNACFRVLQNSFDAEEAMQETFLKAFSELDRYTTDRPFEAWLVRIAINSSIDKFRKNRNTDSWSLNENIQYEVAEPDDNENWDEIMKKVEQVKSAMEKLPESSRLVISLYLIEGYDHQEIAEILNIATGTVRIQYMRAKQKLVELIKKGAHK